MAIADSRPAINVHPVVASLFREICCGARRRPLSCGIVSECTAVYPLFQTVLFPWRPFDIEGPTAADAHPAGRSDGHWQTGLLLLLLHK